jgi:hypothetical protein
MILTGKKKKRMSMKIPAWYPTHFTVLNTDEPVMTVNEYTLHCTQHGDETVMTVISTHCTVLNTVMSTPHHAVLNTVMSL